MAITTLGRYEILGQIGAGSMGTVYRARDTLLDREVALKTIRTGSDVDPELKERFYREARACARLEHPGIIKVYDLAEAGQTAYIAMELLIGSDFRKIIDERVGLALDQKVEAMAQICEALAYAHRHGIIHRDIKPSNLFLVQNHHAKILDFGIARLPSSRLTIAGKILGTPNYMAPEQILVRPVDTRSDLFSLAVVFFELLVYVHPFQSDSIPRRIAEGEPDSLFDYDSNLPIVLDKIFARALARGLGERYRTGDEFATDLRALLEGLRQNASPTFSRFQLPSDRELPVQPVAAPKRSADATLLRPAPPGEDAHEWRLSEVLRLIPEFEAAVEQGNSSRARAVFAQLEALEAIDLRFADALNLCRSQLGTLPPVAAYILPLAVHPVPIPPVQPDPPVNTKRCSLCGAANQSNAELCAGCATSFTHPASAPVESTFDPDQTIRVVVARPPDHDEIAKAPLSPPPPDHVEISRQPAPPPPAKGLTRGQMQVIILGVGAILILGLAAILVKMWPVPILPAVATAVVSSRQANLWDKPAGSSIASLKSGDRVNVLKLPDNREQEWAEVQVATIKTVTRPGFVRVRDLDPESWDSPNPDRQLQLIRVFHANGAGSSTEIDRLEALIAQFPDTLASRQASLEIARLQLSALRTARDSGHVPDPLMLVSVQEHLNGAAVELSLTGEVEQLRSSIAGLTPSSPTPPTPPVAPAPHPVATKPASRVNFLLKEADGLFNEPDPAKQFSSLKQAEFDVEAVLKEQPGNQSALKLRDKIRNAKRLYQ